MFKSSHSYMGMTDYTIILQPYKTEGKCTRTVSSTRDPVHHSVTTDHSPTDNVPITDNQCYGSAIYIVGSSVQHHVTVSSNPCYETVTQGIDNNNKLQIQPESVCMISVFDYN